MPTQRGPDQLFRSQRSGCSPLAAQVRPSSGAHALPFGFGPGPSSPTVLHVRWAGSSCRSTTSPVRRSTISTSHLVIAAASRAVSRASKRVSRFKNDDRPEEPINQISNIDRRLPSSRIGLEMANTARDGMGSPLYRCAKAPHHPHSSVCGQAGPGRQSAYLDHAPLDRFGTPLPMMRDGPPMTLSDPPAGLATRSAPHAPNSPCHSIETIGPTPFPDRRRRPRLMVLGVMARSRRSVGSP